MREILKATDAIVDRLEADGRFHLLYLAVSGSHAYGTAVETSDVDVRGVVLPRWKEFAGLHPPDGLHLSGIGEPDAELMNLHKFANLVCRGNPNVVDWLHVPDDLRVQTHPAFSWFVESKAGFLTKRFVSRCLGYASGQMAQMEAADMAPGAAPGARHRLGEKRKREIEQYGFCTTAACHAVRVLDQALEALTTGTYSTLSPKAAELVAIRRGALTLGQVRDHIEKLTVRVREAEAESKLPQVCNEAAVEEVVVAICTSFYRANGR